MQDAFWSRSPRRAAGASPTGVQHTPQSCPTLADEEAGTVIHYLPLSSAQGCFQGH